MIEWRIYKGDKPSPVLALANVFIMDWKRNNPSHSEIDGMDLMVLMSLVPQDTSGYRLERVEVPWVDKSGKTLEEISTIIKPLSRSAKRGMAKELKKKEKKGLKKKGKGEKGKQ